MLQWVNSLKLDSTAAALTAAARGGCLAAAGHLTGLRPFITVPVPTVKPWTG